MTPPAEPGALSRRRLLAAFAGAVAACDMPRDADGALARVRADGRLRIGALDNLPWVRVRGTEADGIEPALLGDWARQLGAEPVWLAGGEAELFGALRQRALDVVAGGILRNSPWAPDVALSQPFLTSRVRLGVRPGVAVPQTWAGERIRVGKERLSVLGPVRALGAIPIFDPADDEPTAAVVAYDFALPRLGLVAAGPVLKEEEHVLASAPGESALLFALDRFLGALGEPAIWQLAAEQAAA